MKPQILASAIGLLLLGGAAHADVPGQINFQGKIEAPRAEEEANEHGINKGEKEHSKLFPFTGTGFFKFAIVDGQGNVLWTNTPNIFTVPPPNEVAIQVKNGIFNVALGDPAMGMPPITQAVFQGSTRLLRIFFKTPKQATFAELQPAQKLLTVPFAFTSALAQSLPIGATVEVNTVISSSVGADVLTAASGTIMNLTVPGFAKFGSDSIYEGRVAGFLGAGVNVIAFTGGPAIIMKSATVPPLTIPGGSSLDLEAAGGLFLNTVSTGLVIMSTQPTSLVGIGTTLPSEKLEVSGNIKSDFGVIASTAAFGSAASSSTFGPAGALTLASNQPLSLSGAGGAITTASSITASAFFGNGAGLTGITATDNTKVAKAGDTMTGQLTLAGSTLTVAGQDASGFSVRLSSGLSAPAGTVSAGFFVGNGAGLTNITATDNTKVAKAGDTMTGQLTLSGSTLTVTGRDVVTGYSLSLSSGINTPAGTVTAGLFVGNGSGLTNLPAAAGLSNPVNTTLTLNGSPSINTGTQPSINISTNIAVTGSLGVGTTNPLTPLEVNGSMRLDPIATPASPAPGQVWFDNTRNVLSYRNLSDKTVEVDPPVIVVTNTQTRASLFGGIAVPPGFWFIGQSVYGQESSTSSLESFVQGVLGFTGTVQKLSCLCTGTCDSIQGVGLSCGQGSPVSFMLRKNGTNTSLSCTTTFKSLGLSGGFTATCTISGGVPIGPDDVVDILQGGGFCGVPATCSIAVGPSVQ